MNTRWTLRVVNARSAHHAWSKQHVLHTIFALVIASIITLPSSAFAEELSHNALAAAAVQAAVQTTVQTASANQTSQVAKTPTAQTPTAQTPTAQTPAVQSPANQVVQAPQASVTPATPAAADVQNSVTEASDAKESAAQAPAASVPEAALAPDSAAQTPAASATKTPDPATQAQTQAPAAPALDPEKYQDSLGTTLEFDWDKNGSTSKEDWLAFRKWLADYTPVKDGGNAEGGNTAMGAINIRVNKPEEGTKTLLPGVDVSKVKHY